MITGHMQKQQFNLISVLQHASLWHPEQEIVTHSVEGGIYRTNYSRVYGRTQQLANALTRLGVQSGNRIATMAWNTWRHLECWYGISGIGAVCHTLNPRLFPDQIEYIVNHAEDSYIFIDTSFLPVIINVLETLPTLKGIIILTDKDNMPDTSAINVPIYCYEDLIADEKATFDWPMFDEHAASSLCYTSGTTGNPKGVLYSHRSNIIHALASTGADVLNIKSTDNILMIVPMFHANSWGLAFSVPMAGAKLVMPGPHMSGESIYDLISNEGVTSSAAVPTVWTGLLKHLSDNNLGIPTLKETVIGGSAVPRSMIDTFVNDYNVDVIQAWGMTETSPLGSLNRLTGRLKTMDAKLRQDIRVKQGRPVYGVEMKIVDEDGHPLPHNGEDPGNLLVRGPWVIERYYKAKESALDAAGWLDTGDVATIDEYGFMQITDRSKDLIKSGGEWISSIDIENSAVGHADIEIAACIGVTHPKWEERPLLLAVAKPGKSPSIESIQKHIETEHAKWQVPDTVIFIDEMPLTATGKIDKKPLKKKYMDYYVNS